MRALFLLITAIALAVPRVIIVEALLPRLDLVCKDTMGRTIGTACLYVIMIIVLGWLRAGMNKFQEPVFAAVLGYSLLGTRRPVDS